MPYLYPRLLHKLNVDKMRLSSIRLPKCIDVVISDLFHAISRLGRTQCPDCLIANLSSCGIGCRSNSFVDERLTLNHYLNAITVLLKSIILLWMEIDIESIEASMDNVRHRRLQRTSSIELSKGWDRCTVCCRHTNWNPTQLLSSHHNMLCNLINHSSFRIARRGPAIPKINLRDRWMAAAGGWLKGQVW